MTRTKTAGTCAPNAETACLSWPSPRPSFREARLAGASGLLFSRGHTKQKRGDLRQVSLGMLVSTDLRLARVRAYTLLPSNSLHSRNLQDFLWLTSRVRLADDFLFPVCREHRRRQLRGLDLSKSFLTHQNLEDHGQCDQLIKQVEVGPTQKSAAY
jgi:hypothetical protein